jgi:exodeoxyribonuclease-1
MTYIFYDTETTGLNPAFDQIVQFAAIVTNDNFDIVEELDLRCRLRPHIIASPGAMRVTRVGPKAIQSAPLSCYEMAGKLRAFIEKWSPAVLIGFNSISFDEHMLRQMFFQGLHPTYLTNTNGNSRMDVLRLAHAVDEHQPGILSVPMNEKGKPSFKLGDLIKANGLALQNAHDALADTSATLELARYLRGKAPQVWDSLYACRSRHAAESWMAESRLFLYTDRAFKKPTILSGTIAANTKNPAAVAVFDLEYAPGTYLDSGVDEIKTLLKASPRPIRIVRTNALPIIVPVSEPFNGLDLATAKARLDEIQEHPFFARTVADALSAVGEEFEPPDHVEQTIYSGFPSRRDQKLMEEFHNTSWAARFALLERFEDRRYQEFGERILYAEFPEGLPPERVTTLKSWHHQRHATEEKVPWLTLALAKEELKTIRLEALLEDHPLMDEIEQYLAKQER